MSSRLIICVDIGSTRTKAAVFDFEGNLLSKAVKHLRIKVNNRFGTVEADPLEWVSATVFSIKKALSGLNREEISGICIASEGPTLVAVDKDFQPVAPAMLWMDYRAVAEAEFISKKVGYRIDSSWIPPKALWISRNNPQLFSRIDTVFQPLDYVSSVFTGEKRFSIVSDEFNAIPNRLWTQTGLPDSLVPERILMGEIHGKLRKEWAAEMGLKEGIPLIAGTGGVDAIQVILGTATLEEGLVCDKAGTSEGIEIVTRNQIKDERFFTAPHPLVSGHYHVGGVMSTTGKALEWFRNCFYPKGTTFRHILWEAGRSSPGSNGLVFLPYLMGERSPVWDEKARAVFFGLSLSHKRGDLARAVLEGVAFGIDQLICILREKGVSAVEMRTAGGPARSGLWNQIKADITGLPVRVCIVPEVELLGLAIIAGRALGFYNDFKEAATRMVKFKSTLYPRERMAHLYERQRKIYRELYGLIKHLY